MIRYARLPTGNGPVWAQEIGESWDLLDAAPYDGGVSTGRRVRNPGLFLAPGRPTKIIAIGSNYWDHAKEMGKPVPTLPKIFFKPPSAIIGPGDSIVIPPRTTRVDHEAELGVVIGRQATRVPVSDALDYVFGYTLVNDVTARDFQAVDGVFARAKGFDSFCPVGPLLVTGLDAGNLPLICRVDGQLRQDGNTADMVFNIATLVAFISDIMTLEPGDLISTGTPAGVGPLHHGQMVVVECPAIGRLENPVVDRDDR